MQDLSRLIDEQASFIASYQLPSGAIPWYEGGITDPWDHVECAIALDLAGKHDEAVRAYRWLKDVQNTDGSWYSSYADGQAEDLVRDSNFSSYIASGLWYHYLSTKNLAFLEEMWLTVERAITFALSLQQPTGEVFWAYGKSGRPWRGALVAGSSCTWQNIRNAIKIAELFGQEKLEWCAASDKLLEALTEHPELFDRFGEDSQRFATSWFYPVLAGVMEGEKAREHILSQWGEFVIDNWGCKCVSTAPWVTTAETCELIMSSCLIGEMDRARLLLDWIVKLQDPLGGFKTGIKLPEEIVWPEEKTTWTSAGFIIAVKALARVEGKDLG